MLALQETGANAAMKCPQCPLEFDTMGLRAHMRVHAKGYRHPDPWDKIQRAANDGRESLKLNRRDLDFLRGGRFTHTNNGDTNDRQG